MAAIEGVEVRMVNLIPKTKRVDAIQSFVSQETPIVRIADADGAVGIGYSLGVGMLESILPARVSNDRRARVALRRCLACGQSFKPKRRTDACYCSGAWNLSCPPALTRIGQQQILAQCPVIRA